MGGMREGVTRADLHAKTGSVSCYILLLFGLCIPVMGDRGRWRDSGLGRSGGARPGV